MVKYQHVLSLEDRRAQMVQSVHMWGSVSTAANRHYCSLHESLVHIVG